MITEYFKRKRMEKLRELLLHRIRQYLRFDRDYIQSIKYIDGKDIKSTTCHQNNRCHLVARTISNSNSFMKFIPCIILDDKPIVHFINYDMENEVYIDNTLGAGSRDYSYFILNCYWIDYETYVDEPHKALHEIKRDLYRRFLDSVKDADDLINYYGIDEII